MTKTCATVFTILLVSLGLAVPRAQAAEPIAPPDTTKPKIHVVDLEEDVTIRMGDTVSLKGTDFSVKLVEFSGSAESVKPEFVFTEGTTTCESKKRDKACLHALHYMVKAKDVTDRTAVRLLIKTADKKKHRK